jgi:hypothetical protein
MRVGVTIGRLIEDAAHIVGEIKVSHLQRYDWLQGMLRRTDVTKDREFQRTFNGFFKMGKKTPEWYQFYFSLLEREKNNESLTFKSVFEQIFRSCGRVEPSFSSKLLASVCPDKPIYDKILRQNLCLDVPKQHKRREERVLGYEYTYAELETKMDALMSDSRFPEARGLFDEHFPRYRHFTDAKKLDFLLWQHRPSERSTLIAGAQSNGCSHNV